MRAETTATAPKQAKEGLGFFERYLSLWVGLCMVAGVILGKLLPSWIQALRGFEFASGSQINVPIAVLIWLMITPMMMKVDFESKKRQSLATWLSTGRLRTIFRCGAAR